MVPPVVGPALVPCAPATAGGCWVVEVGPEAEATAAMADAAAMSVKVTCDCDLARPESLPSDDPLVVPLAPSTAVLRVLCCCC